MYTFGYTFILTATKTATLRVDKLPTPTGLKISFLLPKPSGFRRLISAHVKGAALVKCIVLLDISGGEDRK